MRASTYDLSLLPPDPPEQPAPTLVEALTDLAAALGLAAAGAREDAAQAHTLNGSTLLYGKAHGLDQARALVEALAAGLAPSSPQAAAGDLPPDLDF